MNNLDNLFLKNFIKVSFLPKSKAPLSIANIGIEKSLKQSKNTEI